MFVIRLRQMIKWIRLFPFYPAAMAELVDALDSGSSRGNPVDVRVILAAKLAFN